MDTNFVKLDRGANTCVTIHKHGATITSWVVAGEEMLFLSSKAIFDGKTPIRGGIPLVFPHFGPWGEGKPKHGFARVSEWSVAAPPFVDSNGNVNVALHLDATPETKKIWNYDFSLVLKVVLKEAELDVALTVNNVDEKSISFTTLLHNYLKLSDISTVTVDGLHGLLYKDALRKMQVVQEDSKLTRISGPVDRIYMNSPRTHVISDEGKDRSVALNKSESLPDVVVWTPWSDGARGLKDMDDDEYKQFVCVESGRVSEPVTLEAGECYVARQTLTMTPLMNIEMP